MRSLRERLTVIRIRVHVLDNRLEVGVPEQIIHKSRVEVQLAREKPREIDCLAACSPFGGSTVESSVSWNTQVGTQLVIRHHTVFGHLYYFLRPKLTEIFQSTELSRDVGTMHTQVTLQADGTVSSGADQGSCSRLHRRKGFQESVSVTADDDSVAVDAVDGNRTVRVEQFPEHVCSIATTAEVDDQHRCHRTPVVVYFGRDVLAVDRFFETLESTFDGGGLTVGGRSGHDV